MLGQVHYCLFTPVSPYIYSKYGSDPSAIQKNRDIKSDFIPIRIPTEKYRSPRFGEKALRNSPRASRMVPKIATKRYPNLLVRDPATGPVNTCVYQYKKGLKGITIERN